jgi:hypothetical protein
MENQNIQIPQIKPEAPAAQPAIGINTTVNKPNPVLLQKRGFNLSFFKNSKKGKIILIALSVVAVLILVSVIQGLSVYKNGKKFYASVKQLSTVVKGQNIDQAKTEITNTKKSLKGLQSSVRGLFWLKLTPFLGTYIKDAEAGLKAAQYGLDAGEITLITVEPYMSILGFGSGKQAEDGVKTTQERIDFIVKAIPDLTAKIGEISGKVELARKELDKVDPNQYPVKFKGKAVREPLRNALSMFDEAATLINQSKPLLEVTPYLLGVDGGARNYFLLFQNDKELRPTGGFMTGYAITKVEKAKFEPTASNDIYNLDAQYKPVIEAPDPIVKYIKGPYILSKNIRLRDMNWSPDFAVSMKQFTEEAAKVGVTNIDGIIAVDTQLLVNLLDAMGPIAVSGFGTFSTAIEPKCNCPQVIYELESFADVEGPIIWDPLTGKIIYRPPNSDNRKKIIGPLMNSIMANALGQPKDKLPKLFEAAFKSLVEKHVLLYLNDEKAQKAVEDFNLAGRIKDYQGDYLHINDSNLGGRKSNLYVQNEISQEISVGAGGAVEKTVTITYKNPEKHDGWLNSVLPDWVRIYVPKGSQLISIEGLEEKAEPYEDLGKTVFAGYFELRPEGVSKVTVKYKLPFKVAKEYKLLIQKQPGLNAPLYTIKLGRQEEELFLKTDKEFKFSL